MAKVLVRFKKILLFFILYLLLLSFGNAYLAFTVSPAKIEKTVFGAGVITEVFEVQNVSNDTLRIKLSFEGFEIDEDGNTKFLAPDGLINSIAPHTTVNPEEFFIAPQGKEFIRLTFNMPQDSVPEYYGMLIFKSQPIPSVYQPMIQIAGEIGIPVYYSKAEFSVKDAVIENLYVQKDSFYIVLKNIGTIHIRMKGEAMILTTDEKIVEKDSIFEFVIFPERVRKVKVPIKGKMNKGEYIIRVRFDYGITKILEGERRFKIEEL